VSGLDFGTGSGRAALLAALWSVATFELVALLSVPSVLLHRRGRPSAALSWLLALFALPALGTFLWWAFGRTRIEKRRRTTAAKRREFAELRGNFGRPGATPFDRLFPERAFGDGVFTSACNRVSLLADGPAFFSAVEARIRAARHSIHITVYIFRNDATGQRIWQLLEERSRAGVKVRVLVDGFGTGRSGWLVERAAATGIQLAVFLPERFRPFYAPRVNFVNHRKIVVIDNEVAFTGGMNFAAEYAGTWRDLMIQVQGPSVGALEYVFFEDWYFATSEVLEAPPLSCESTLGLAVATIASGPDSEPWILDAYFIFITQATTRVWIATPYFIPSPPVVEALRTAAGRGVDVRVIVPARSDVSVVAWAARSYYRNLLEAGVQIFEYQGPMLHAKALVQDERLLSVGTANIDSRSFRLSFEVSCFVESEALCQDLSLWLTGLMDDSTSVTLSDLEQKGTLVKLVESAAHLFSPIL
jgi:cardiolipin synthase A/B